MAKSSLEKRISVDDASFHFLPTVREVADKRAACLARYVFAEKFVKGRTVCDVACGTGYGSGYLARTAKRVVGIDISIEAVDWAQKHFGADNVTFLKADVIEPWPVQGKFDVVTSFETMEHLKTPERFLDLINEHLLPGATLLLSVPNGPCDLQNHSDNYRHLQHFSDNDLRGLLEPRFSEVECFSQIYTKNLRHYLAKVLKMRSVRLVSNYDFVPGLLLDVKTWLVVAHK